MKKVLTKKHYIVILVLGAFCSLSFQNCSQLGSSDSITAGSSTSNGLAETDVLLQKSMLILQSSCVRCHSAEIPTNGVNLSSVDLMLTVGVVIPNEPILSPLMQVLQNPSIPEHGILKQKDVSTLSKWILEGFKEGGSGVAPPPGEVIPLAGNYRSLSANIFSRKCAGCHNSTILSGGISFTAYAGVRSRVTPGDVTGSLLYRRVAGLQGNRMPLNGLPLTTEELNAIAAWITGGALDNQ